MRHQPGLRGRSAQPGDRNSSGAQGRLEESGFQGSGTEGSVEGLRRHDRPGWGPRELAGATPGSDAERGREGNLLVLVPRGCLASTQTVVGCWRVAERPEGKPPRVDRSEPSGMPARQ